MFTITMLAGNKADGGTCKKKNIPKDVAENLVVNAICENILRPDTLEDLADAIAAAQQADVNQPDPPDVKIGTTIFSKKAKK